MSTQATSAPLDKELQDEFNPFLAMAKRFDIAADHLDLDQGLRDVLRTPDRELTVSVPVLMDDKRIRVYTGYRVQHNFVLGDNTDGAQGTTHR